MTELADIDRQEAREDLNKSLVYRERKSLGFVHYECEEIGEGKGIHAIAVKLLGGTDTQLFTAESGEKAALETFSKFMAKYSSDANLWCVWGMRSESYGFPHLDARLRNLAKGKAGIPTPENVLDLSKICWQLFGDIDTGGTGKLLYLCGANSIPTLGCADCSTIQEAVRNKTWPVVHASVQRKVEMIYALWGRMLEDRLITNFNRPASSSPEDKKAKQYVWLSQAMLLLRDHPDWPDAKIARKVGKHPATLCRNTIYTKMAGMVRGNKENIPIGYIQSGDGGQYDTEAICHRGPATPDSEWAMNNDSKGSLDS